MQQQEILEPGRALNRLLFVLFIGWLFYLGASAPGWEALYLGVLVCGAGAFRALVDLVQAHRAWKAREAFEAMSRENSGVHTRGFQALLARVMGGQKTKKKPHVDKGWK